MPGFRDIPLGNLRLISDIIGRRECLHPMPQFVKEKNCLSQQSLCATTVFYLLGTLAGSAPLLFSTMGIPFLCSVELNINLAKAKVYFSVEHLA